MANFKLPEGTELPDGIDLPAGRFYYKPKYMTDKFESGNIDVYKKLFKALDYTPISLLEIGMGMGGSMKYFNDFFKHKDSRFVGFDINRPETTFDSRTTVHDCNQNDENKIKRICHRHGPFDIIIDDGCHFAKETQHCFDITYSKLKPGGYYIIEDFGAHYSSDESPFVGMLGVIQKIMSDVNQLNILSYNIILDMENHSTAVFRKGF